jgi:hypothetical protein
MDTGDQLTIPRDQVAEHLAAQRAAQAEVGP